MRNVRTLLCTDKVKEVEVKTRGKNTPTNVYQNKLSCLWKQRLLVIAIYISICIVWWCVSKSQKSVCRFVLVNSRMKCKCEIRIRFGCNCVVCMRAHIQTTTTAQRNEYTSAVVMNSFMQC